MTPKVEEISRLIRWWMFRCIPYFRVFFQNIIFQALWSIAAEDFVRTMSFCRAPLSRQSGVHNFGASAFNCIDALWRNYYTSTTVTHPLIARHPDIEHMLFGEHSSSSTLQFLSHLRFVQWYILSSNHPWGRDYFEDFGAQLKNLSQTEWTLIQV